MGGVVGAGPGGGTVGLESEDDDGGRECGDEGEDVEHELGVADLRIDRQTDRRSVGVSE